MSARLVLLGPPGSGKGTQGALLADFLGVPEISTGAIFRKNLSEGTPLGLEAQTYMSQGHLVPDSVTNAMVADRLSQPDAADGFILDGYPRNVEQAGVLDQMLAEHGWTLSAALELDLDEELAVKRMLHRAEIEGRADDTEPVIRERLTVYHQQTEPISSLYKARGDLVVVDGDGTLEQVTERIKAALAPYLS
ncbi:MAG: adenylate kinase [Bifidobacteriaceae bacterium]|jgi:adenylate kinase|nr:adenylate kinase [Bifidobacteriaceae bacterium]